MSDINNIDSKILPQPAVSSTSLGQIAFENTYTGGRKKRRTRVKRNRKSNRNGKTNKNCWWKFF